MKKKAQKFSFIMMIIFCLMGIATTIVTAVTISMSIDTAYGSYSSMRASSQAGGYIFLTILVGLVTTFSVTSIWWAVLEHFKNIEKGIDSSYRNSTGKEELPDSAYSYVPASIQTVNNIQPNFQQPYQPYNQQQVPPVQPAQPVQQVQPVQPQNDPAAQNSGNWFCPNCGTQNSSNALFCAGCGQKNN